MNKAINILLLSISILFFSCAKEKQIGIDNSSQDIVMNSLTTTGPRKFLFDAKHAETAGNADWVIDEDNSTPQRTPTPAQSNIISSTTETFWTGALSSWGVALVKQGFNLETLPSSGSLTYGTTTNVQDLKNYDVFVVDEPNTRFTTAEKTAIINFVRDGGGLFMISDHTISDRNNDGWDSPAIWNDLMSSNTVQVNPFGFSLDLQNYSETSTNVTKTSNPIINGSLGNVTGMKFNNGTSLTLSANSLAKGLIWRTGSAQSTTKIMAAYSTYGLGRVVVVCDSSPADDGTGAPNNILYPGWTDLSGNHSKFHLNASRWLARM